MAIKSDKDICFQKYTGRFLYIGSKKYELIVLDFETAPSDDQGGLYLWRYDRNPDPENLVLGYDGRVEIIGIDII